MENTFYFSVEGETEKRYLLWLERTMNRHLADKARFQVKIEKDPYARAKGLAAWGDIEIVHLADVESNEGYHLEHFRRILRRMRLVEEKYPSVTYTLGYCNYTFELWILLHKADCPGPLSCRKDYLPLLNDAFGTDFQGLNQYKRERGFSRILSMLTLDDVRRAIEKANRIEERNIVAYGPEETAGYTYFLQNPALSLGTIFEDILAQTDLL